MMQLSQQVPLLVQLLLLLADPFFFFICHLHFLSFFHFCIQVDFCAGFGPFFAEKNTKMGLQCNVFQNDPINGGHCHTCFGFICLQGGGLYFNHACHYTRHRHHVFWHSHCRHCSTI